MEKKNSLKLVDWIIVIPVAIILIPLIIYGFVSPEGLANLAGIMFNISTGNFGAIMLIGPFALVVICIGIMFSKWGSVRIGGEHAKPEMGYFAWFSVALTTCIGIGLVYYGTYEPLLFYVDPPAFTGCAPQSPEAMDQWGYIFMHWLITPYSLYTGAGLFLTMMVWNAKRKNKFSTAIYPLLGEKVDGKIGSVINAAVLLVTFGGLCASIGVASIQLTAGAGFITGKDFSSGAAYTAIIAIIAVICILTTTSGLGKGMTYLAKINVILFFALLIGVFVLGHTTFQMDSMTHALGYYLDNFVQISLRTEPSGIGKEWVANWTIFFNAWYLVCAPIFGIFLVKLAKGRTIREFIAVNLIGPSIFIFLWFGAFGSEAIYIQANGLGDLAGDLSVWGAGVANFALGEYLPLSAFFKWGGLVAVFLSFATCMQSQILAISDSCMVGSEEGAAPVSLRVFWAVIGSAFGLVMLLSGGYSNLQSVLVALGPVALVLLLLAAISFIKGLVQRDKYDLIYNGQLAEENVGSSIEEDEEATHHHG